MSNKSTQDIAYTSQSTELLNEFSEKPSILYVDDEEDNLVVFKSSFRRHFKVFTAMSGEEGLKILLEEDISVVITDQRMPKMTGIQFLKNIPAEKDPVRIVLTGYADTDSFLDCINNGMVHRYIMKPWNKEELKNAIENAVALYKRLSTYHKSLTDLMVSNQLLEQKVAARSLELDLQKSETEKLLLNILPSAVAFEMQQTGHVTPRYYESSTVLVAELTLADGQQEDYLWQEVIVDLNYCFTAFDSILDKHNLEKIKSVNQKYICAGGIPTTNFSHPVDAILAALEFKSVVSSLNEKREADNQSPLVLRVGVHTGPLTTGVVGFKKFTYDIWGATHTIAQQLLASCEDDKVNISQDTFRLVKDWFNCLYHGKTPDNSSVEMEMYYVEEQLQHQ